MDGEEEFYEGLAELAERNSKLVAGDEDDPREERGREVDLQLLREMVYSLESVSMGTHQLLYFSSMRYVREYMDCDASSVEESIGKLADVFDSMNLGGLSLRDDEKPFRVELEENAFTYEAPESGRTMCYFISGYIAGFLENCLGKKYVVNEKSCSAEGSGSCIFEIRER